jgi:hypothetical protein
VWPIQKTESDADVRESARPRGCIACIFIADFRIILLQDLGIRVWILGFRVLGIILLQDLGIRVWILGFGVLGFGD